MIDQIQQTLNERGKNYGSFDDVAAMSQQLKAVLLDSNTHLEPHQREAGEILPVMRCWAADWRGNCEW